MSGIDTRNANHVLTSCLSLLSVEVLLFLQQIAPSLFPLLTIPFFSPLLSRVAFTEVKRSSESSILALTEPLVYAKNCAKFLDVYYFECTKKFEKYGTLSPFT